MVRTIYLHSGSCMYVYMHPCRSEQIHIFIMYFQTSASVKIKLLSASKQALTSKSIRQMGKYLNRML